MRQFWDIALEPVLSAVAPQRILEIGVDQGLTTKRLIDFAVAGGAFLDAIDPDPKIDTGEWQREQPGHVRFHRGLSVDVIPELDPPDVVLIDGDHNWFTVHSELGLLERRADAAGELPPVALVHDVQWPYARRDLYYDAETIPKLHRHPHERAGLTPDRSEVVEQGGFNAHLDHAIYEGGDRNGVLSAVEDFVASSAHRWRMTLVGGLHGLAILAPVARLEGSKALRDTILALGRAPALRAVTALVEAERITSETRRQAATRQLEPLRVESERAVGLQRDLDRSLEEVARLRTDLDGHDPEAVNRLELEVERLHAVHAESEREHAAIAERQASVPGAEQEATNRADQAESDRERAMAGLATAEAERQVEYERRLGAEGELLSAARTQAALEGRLAAQDHELAALREDAQSARAEAAAAAATARTAREAADEFEHLRDRTERRRQTLERREEELEEELLLHRRKHREAADRQDELERVVESLQRRLEDLDRALESARQAAADATAQRERAETQLAAQSDQLDGRITALTLELSDAAGDRDASARELERARAATAEAAAERDGLALQLAAQTSESEALVATRTRQAADAADARESMERALEDTRAEAAAAEAALAKAATAQSTQRDLSERLEIAAVELEARDEQLAALQRALTLAHADAEQARAYQAAAEARASHVARVPAPPPAPAAVLAPVTAAALPSAPAPPAAAAEAPPAIPPITTFDIEHNEHELAAHEYFRREYDGDARGPGVDAVTDPVALPAARDPRGNVRAEHDGVQPSVDIVVCVHNALDDVRRCLWSVMHKTDRPYRLVVVNDGSDAATTEYLEQVVAAVPGVRLVHQVDPPHGYTIAANLGLRAATGDYVVLLNSDTIVTLGWLDRIIDCGESDERIGILGPLSNAASHQSIPALRDAAGWSTNPLPPFTTPDAIAELLERVSPRDRPRIPFVNGFCYVIKRAVIDAIGYLDEEHFASGYCEENDFSYRATQAGFELAVVDDGYVHHAKSKSFGVETRKVIAKRNYEIFLDKHGRETIQAAVKGLEQSTALTPLRAKVSDALSSPHALAAALDSARRGALSVMFVLPGLGEGGSGGSHSIYQEVHGMRALGLDARIALRTKSFDRARAAYDDADEVFVPYQDESELEAVTARADVIAATHFKSAVLVAQLRERRDDFLPAYYVQDYEPFFTARDSADVDEAIASYTLIPGCLLFAKTHWLCNIVSERHDVFVAKVEPSIDERLYRPSGARRHGGPLRVTAMVRPRTPRRQPTATVAVLERLSLERGAEVEVTTFGCHRADLERLTDHPPLLAGHRGMLRRGEVAELLGASDVFLDLSMYQAFGRTALEAMACGTTAVVPRLGGVWEFLEHDVNGIAVDTFAPQQALAALSGLADDRVHLEALQAAARQTGERYSVLRAALSEYLVLAREHALRFGARS